MLDAVVDYLPAPTDVESIKTVDADGKPITVGSGRYGPYVKHRSLYASLPKTMTADDVTLDQAIELLAAKAAKAGPGKTPAKARKTKPATATAETPPGDTTPTAAAKAKATKATKARAGKTGTPAAVEVTSQAANDTVPVKPSRSRKTATP